MGSLKASLLSGQAKPVRLRVAASLVYQELTGNTRAEATAGRYLNALADSALALSHIADVYYVNDERKLLRIPSEDLASGRFEAGADVFRTRSGKVYRSLYMRRIEFLEAIAALKRAHGAIEGAKAAPPAHEDSA